MVQKTETRVTLIDDLDGSKADRTVAFSYDGAAYEIELSKKNANALDKALAPYIAAARKAKSSPRAGRAGAGTTRRSRSQSRSDLGAVREWARGNGLDVSERGRIAQSVQDAYDAAH